ncbi:MAG: putative transport system permease protein [Actinomycetota bacterium]|jgi:putative ABC transport system permease protein|nr:putative transport system permease protein [Actinomycetota bacterium]
MSPSSLPPLLVLVAVALLAVAWQFVRRPVQRRFAIRNAGRRPTETILLIAGSLLGTAIITGSFIVGDTLDSSIRVTAKTQLGPVDEVVRVPTPQQARTIAQNVRNLHDPRIDGVMALRAVPASFSSSASGARRAQPGAQALELNMGAARVFGEDPTSTGIRGPTPAPGHVVLGADLAQTLAAGRGDEVTLFLYGKQMRLSVDRVLPRLGLAGLWFGVETTSANAFVAPGTIASIVSHGIPKGAVPPDSTVIVSNRGGVDDGAALTGAVDGVLRKAIADPSVRVDDVKQNRLDAAKAQGDSFRTLFVGIGEFAVLAGILLLINIFVMLSEERKKQLGMLRAVGTSRADLVRGFTMEGAIYALVAGVAGAIFGIGVGWAIVKFAAPIFAGFGDFSLDLSFAFQISSVIGGFCIGVLISLVAVFFTSLRISRVNIIRAIRDLPEPRLERVRTRTLVLGLLLTAVGLLWFAASLGHSSAWAGMLLAPPMAAFGLLPVLTRLIKRRPAVLLVSGFALLWGVFGDTILGSKLFESGSISAFVAQGVLLTFSAVVFLSQIQENLAGILHRIAAKGLSLRLGMAYPLARRFRTGLTLGMYSLVLFTMVFISVLATVFGGQVDSTTRKAAGGFDMFVTASASNPPTAAALSVVKGVAKVTAIDTGTALFQPQSFPQAKPWFASGIDRSFVDVGTPVLSKRAPGLSSSKAVWDRLLTDPHTMVIDSFFLQAGGGPATPPAKPGDSVAVLDPITGARTERKVIGVVDSDATNFGVYMSKKSLHQAVSRATPSLFYMTVTPGQNPSALGARLQGRFFREGVEAKTFRSTVEKFSAVSLQFLRLMQGYLALGLLVGIAGLGVVMVRAVRERRHSVGVLRSLGFQTGQVRMAFLLESGFIAIEGILVGTVLALITSKQLVATGQFGKGVVFTIPWVQIGILVAIAFVASLIATAWPAQQASQIAPAVALRIAD